MVNIDLMLLNQHPVSLRKFIQDRFDIDINIPGYISLKVRLNDTNAEISDVVIKLGSPVIGDIGEIPLGKYLLAGQKLGRFRR